MFDVEMRREERNGEIKTVLQTWIGECDGNEEQIFQSASPVCQTSTDFVTNHLMLCCSPLKRAPMMHWECHSDCTVMLDSISYPNTVFAAQMTTAQHNLAFFSILICQHNLQAATLSWVHRRCCHGRLFIAVMRCYRCCSRIGSNFLFLFVKGIRLATSGQCSASSSW